MLISALILSLVFGVVWGFAWGALDAGIEHVTSRFIEENQVTMIVRMVVSGMIASRATAFLLALVFGMVPGGFLANIISLVVAILLWQRAREYTVRMLNRY